MAAQKAAGTAGYIVKMFRNSGSQRSCSFSNVSFTTPAALDEVNNILSVAVDSVLNRERHVLCRMST